MSYYIRVQYQGPRGETLTRRLHIGADRPEPGRHPFDGTVWVSVEDPRDATLTQAGDAGRSSAYGLLAAASLLASIILGIWGLVSWSDSLLP